MDLRDLLKKTALYLSVFGYFLFALSAGATGELSQSSSAQPVIRCLRRAAIDFLMPYLRLNREGTPLTVYSDQGNHEVQSMVLGERLGYGATGDVYRVEVRPSTSLAVKIPRHLSGVSNAIGYNRESQVIQREIEIQNLISAHYDDIRTSTYFPKDAAWGEKHVPASTIVEQHQTNLGLALFKEILKGKRIQDFKLPLPIEVRKGLEDIWNLKRAITDKVKVSSVVNSATSIEGLEIDINPKNLIWIDHPETMKTLGMSRPGIAFFELDQSGVQMATHLRVPNAQRYKTFAEFMKAVSSTIENPSKSY